MIAQVNNQRQERSVLAVFFTNFKKVLTKGILRDMMYYTRRGIVWIFS